MRGLEHFLLFLALYSVAGSISSKSYKTISYYNPESQENLEVLREAETVYEGIISESDSTENRIEETVSVHNSNPDIYLSTPQLIARYGYPAESHQVTTEDGYILTMHRIPHGKNGSTGNNSSRPVAFLQHGMFGTSADWILNSVEKSLAYMLADLGYDVWLGNARGNIYSQSHVSISTKKIKYWRFSWHEMGKYDLPAEIDYVLKTTGSSDLYYIGHSMGTTMFFVMLATRPEYNSKIRFMAALGPAVYLNHSTSSARYFAKYYGRVERSFLDFVGHGVFLPKLLTKIITKLSPEFCTPELELDELCEEAMFLIAGHDPSQTNYTQLPVILAHVPSTVSTQTGFHYFQIIRSGAFEMYSHGSDKNYALYGSSQPPKYDLSRVKVPVAVFWGQNDVLCDPVDVARLVTLLPNIILNHRVDYPQFNHVDFIFAKDVDILVNKPLIKIMGTY